jgi:hypothetical protein
MLLTFDRMQRGPSQAIQKEYQIHQCTACDWFQFCREVILDLTESKSEMTGGDGKVLEFDESKFGKRKYYWGHYVKSQWVFGDIDGDSGRIFLGYTYSAGRFVFRLRFQKSAPISPPLASRLGS